MTTLRDLAHPLDRPDPLRPILDRIGDAPLVLLGEASHGTHEFYRTRAAITRRLVEERGLDAVIVEADWPDAYRVNRFVRGRGSDRDADAALADFRRFPTWMWRNTDVRVFVRWLRDENLRRPEPQRVGFYGRDLYSLHASMREVVRYLERVDPDAAARARARYACFDHFGESPQSYGYAAGLGLVPDCESEVVVQLMDLRHQAEVHVRRDGLLARDEHFFVEQNARLVKNAEEYYRGMFGERVNTWNVRDTHMAETVAALEDHLHGQLGRRPRIAIWAHDSHLGDARASDRVELGELNVGQLLRQQHGDDCVIVGFTTHRGTVAAASDWDRPVERKRVPPALEESWEHELHRVGLGRFAVVVDDRSAPLLEGRRLLRAIGVVYRPETERLSHYYEAELGRLFDVVVHLEETRAVEPLEVPAGWDRADLPETYPHGL